MILGRVPLLQQQVAVAVVNQDRECTMQRAALVRIDFRCGPQGAVISIDEDDFFGVVVHGVSHPFILCFVSRMHVLSTWARFSAFTIAAANAMRRGARVRQTATIAFATTTEASRACVQRISAPSTPAAALDAGFAGGRRQVANGDAHQLRQCAHTKLGLELCAGVDDRLVADVQLVGDGDVGFALGDQ